MGAHAHHGHGGHHGHHHDHSHAPSPEDAASMRPRLLIAFSLAVVICWHRRLVRWSPEVLPC